MSDAEVVCLPSVLLDRLYHRDLEALWTSDHALRCGVWISLRKLEPIERAAWDAHHQRFAVAIIADEHDGAGHLVRSLLLLPDDEPIPDGAAAMFDVIERSERVQGGPFTSLQWDTKDAGGGAA